VPIDIVGVGLNATDTLIPVSSWPASGSKIEIHAASVLPGGQVASAMVACQSWGLRSRYIGKLGQDSAAALHTEEFRKAGVDSCLLTAAGCSSHQSFILVEDSGERTVLWKRDDRLTIRPEELRREWITDARALHLDGRDTAAAIAAASWANEAGIPVIADLDELYPGVEELIARVDYLIVSRNIPSRLSGKSDLFEALTAVQRRFGCYLTAATLGEEGVLASIGGAFCYRPAFQVNVVDTTGAGDIFHAGFIYGLLHSMCLGQALDFACAAAALNCTAPGARGGVRPVSEVENLIASGFRHPAVFPSPAKNQPTACYVKLDPAIARLAKAQNARRD